MTPRPPDHKPLTATGERLMPDNVGPNVPEHLHRYALACELARGRDVIDVASGEGYGSMLLASRAASVVGIDISAAAVAHAAAKYDRDNLRFVQGSATALPLAAGTADLVASFETIEHLDDHDAMLAEIRRVLRPVGRLVMSSPDKRHYSDATGHDNPFHVRELHAAEFLGLVGRFFRHVTPLFQRVVHGSLLVPTTPGGGFTEYRGDFSDFVAKARLREAMYVVVLASDEPLPPMHVSLWDAAALLDPPQPAPPAARTSNAASTTPRGLARLFGRRRDG
ncbi:MAG: class I SAM-dependent methyltransferase [Planctomycetaceae bacterium]